MRRRGAVAALAAFAVVLGGAASAAATTRTVDTSYESVALGGRLHFEVYLPADYAWSGLRYPVIYFLHGLPATTTSYTALRYVERALDQADREAILVLPQGARAGEADPEYVDHGTADDWETAIATELPRVVDARFRTIADRSGRAVVGISAGGYGAMHLALKHLGTYSVVESWSGYFHPTNPAGTAAISLGSATRDALADVHSQLVAAKPRLRSEPMFIGFYVGRADTRFRAENEQLDREFTAARIPHLFRLYPGGHAQQLWSAQAPAWLGLAVDHLAPAR
jgi:S-formylglutathione hydrolase FrmB